MAYKQQPSKRPSARSAQNTRSTQKASSSRTSRTSRTSGTLGVSSRVASTSTRSQANGRVVELGRDRFAAPVTVKKTPREIASLVFNWALRLLALLFVVASLLFCWNRWWRYDDADDLIGVWTTTDKSASIIITRSEITFSTGDKYDYTLDAGAKTIHFTLASYEGNATYRFSADRTQLYFLDGESSGFDNFVDDLQWTLNSIRASLSGQDIGLDAPEGALIMVKEE